LDVLAWLQQQPNRQRQLLPIDLQQMSSLCWNRKPHSSTIALRITLPITIALTITITLAITITITIALTIAIEVQNIWNFVPEIRGLLQQNLQAKSVRLSRFFRQKRDRMDSFTVFLLKIP
jgi:hypothetical protein